MEIITVAELRSYPGFNAALTDVQLDKLVELTNSVVANAWRTPIDPAPGWVKAIALEVAARPARNPKGLGSWTRSIDDASRTERLPDSAARAGVYLTVDERRDLAGRTRRRQRFGTIRVRLGY